MAVARHGANPHYCRKKKKQPILRFQVTGFLYGIADHMSKVLKMINRTNGLQVYYNE